MSQLYIFLGSTLCFDKALLMVWLGWGKKSCFGWRCPDFLAKTPSFVATNEVCCCPEVSLKWSNGVTQMLTHSCEPRSLAWPPACNSTEYWLWRGPLGIFVFLAAIVGEGKSGGNELSLNPSHSTFKLEKIPYMFESSPPLGQFPTTTTQVLWSFVYQKQRCVYGRRWRPPVDDHREQCCYNCTPAAASLSAVHTVRPSDGGQAPVQKTA